MIMKLQNDRFLLHTTQLLKEYTSLQFVHKKQYEETLSNFNQIITQIEESKTETSSSDPTALLKRIEEIGVKRDYEISKNYKFYKVNSISYYRKVKSKSEQIK